VCKAGANNDLLFFPSTDTCSKFVGYYIWARNGAFSPFLLIDSIVPQSTTNYQHVGAPGNEWYYTVETRDSCPPVYNNFSDTVQVDAIPPLETLFDSISVTEQNKVVLGWRANKTFDFAYYNLYYDSSALNVPLIFFYTDTQYLDNRVNCRPDLNGIAYLISPVDSCENQRVFTNSHRTIFLEYIVDTCSSTVQLDWTDYLGWPKVRSYYIYLSENGSSYQLVDSTANTTFTSGITLGNQYRFFVRGYKEAENISSSSNRIEFNSRKRIEPDSIYITAVDVPKPENNTIALRWYTKENEAVGYEVWGARDSNGVYVFVERIDGEFSKTKYELVFSNNNYMFFKVFGINNCGTRFESINTSRPMFCQASQKAGGIEVAWSPYFTWNTGVQNYMIYRINNSLSSVYENIAVLDGLDTSYLDITVNESLAPCYYVTATQQSGDINNENESAKSYQVCLTGEASVLIPNAFRPTGLNNVFKPEGTFINYQNSTLEIFDRWGGPVIKLENIASGWNGSFKDGTPASQGVYYYVLKIESTNGNSKTYTGFVTLLN
jgi:gliding motility-associated-like protein